MLRFFIVLACILVPYLAQAQQQASYKVITKEYLTYPFSDPNPIPNPSSEIYPYYRFDGFTDEGVMKEWKVIILENDYINVQIMPEIGGKVLTASVKKTGKHFLYNNGVVKFRDIALRGPWASGGIEFNYGIIGHTPNTATPVDYMVRKNEDGSVSCFVSTLDLLTQSRWVVEIKLEKDKAYFTTESYWFNASGMEQSYYTWTNAAIPASDDMKFLYPGVDYIGHDGQAANWPIDSKGRNLSYYSQNDFGGSKSYHVLGIHSNYFGAFWMDDNFGMIHYAKRSDKLGKKIFLWAQSEAGKIWEDLLTDESGQYVETQSGRLFNQNVFQSSFTPFKQVGFSPYSSESWIEYWYPFKGIDGFTKANLVGAFNLKQVGNTLSIKISPVRFINDSLRVYNNEGKLIATTFVQAEPLEATEIKLLLPNGEEPSKLELEGYVLDLLADTHPLSRPLKSPDSFDMSGAYGLYFQGRDLARLRKYKQAEKKIRASLKKMPFLIPSLVEMAKLKLFRMQYDSAFYYSKKALSIDTYNGKANYYYGMAASKLSRYYDALDGFEVASLTPPFRNAAYTALSQLYMKHNNWAKAKEHARLGLQEDPNNIGALQVLHVIARIENDEKLLQKTKRKIKALNPLNHFIRFESYYQFPTKENKKHFKKLIRNELPIQTYLNLAIWYADIGRIEESKRVLELSPRDPIVLYWLAWLNRKENIKQAKHYLKEASQTDVAFVFPSRAETMPILTWAAKKTNSWKPDYFISLVQAFRGNRQKAFAKIKTYSKKLNFAPFYIFRAQLYDKSDLASTLSNIRTAINIDPEEWRYGKILAKVLVKMQKKEEALQVLKKYYKPDKSNYILGLYFVEVLMLNHKYQKSEKVLSNLHVLPFEGANDAREYYRETKLMLAYLAIKNGKYQKALSKIKEATKWPTNLGVGKPYPNLIDDGLENWMKAFVYKKMEKTKLYQEYIKKVDKRSINKNTYLEMIKLIYSNPDQKMF